MTSTPNAAATHGAPLVRQSLIQRIARNPLGLATSIFLLIVVVVAIVAPLLTSFDPAATDTNSLMSAPGGAHLLGTDSAGRDILARIFFGARTTLISAIVVVVTALVVGLPSGLIAGYYGGKFDGIASWYR
jgi:ABC-type dipeptide/oligopeptide/nickel transport system permease subunit